MTHKPTVTIAIPAFNEEKIILKLLNSITRQRQTNHRVESVRVYSDGSTDSTVKLVRENFKEVQAVDSKQNLGKNARINQIMADNRSDILIQVDADITIKDPDTFNKLIKPMLKNKQIGLSCAYHLANDPESFIGRLALFGFKVWDTARNNLKNRAIKYYCEGGLRAFSASYADKFRIPPHDKTISEDDYSFYYAVKNGFQVAVAHDAIVYLDLPDKYQDYVKQMKRLLAVPKLMRKHVEQSYFDQYQVMTTSAKLKALFQELVKSPITGLLYLVLQFITIFQMIFYQPNINKWTPIERK